MSTTKKYQDIIDSPPGLFSEEFIALAKRKIAEANKPQCSTDTPSAIGQLLSELNNVLSENKGGADPAEVEEIVDEKLKKLKVGLGNLDAGVREYINKNSVKIVLEVNQEGNITTSSVGKQTDLFFILLSEKEAGNNVYLYGGAGTGKTYIADQIAKALNYEKITVNCNQFTSQTELIGGQTIEGYQEGKLVRAWGNIDLPPGRNGALLLLDELPKIDANTAGVMNAALSSIKDPKTRREDGTIEPIYIENGRGEKIALKNCFIIATGNSKLNVADPDYEANFKQDLSLQDRFVGSTYQVFINYQFELDNIMRVNYQGKLVDLSWLWNFLIKLREAIIDKNYTNRAFVSTRLMVNLRDSYFVERLELEKPKDNRLPAFKTVIDGVKNFMDLFTDNQRADLETVLGLSEFYSYAREKTEAPLDRQSTDQDRDESKRLIDAWKKRTGQK